MNNALTALLSRYKPTTADEYLRSLREIIQHIALLGLWRAGFFEHASFYGGTALRMFHGLARFSEDLDFSLIAPARDFAFVPYVKSVETELRSMGFEATAAIREKNAQNRVASAFVKTHTLQGMIQIHAPADIIDRLHRDARLKIKVEVDTDPPEAASHEVQDLLVPIPFQVRLYALPSLFAGKLHALLCRSWKSRVKGRDFFDFLWFVGLSVPCDLIHLKARMVQSGHFQKDEVLDRDRLLDLLLERFKTVDFNQAARDIAPFVVDAQSMDLWSERLFCEAGKRIRTQ